MALRVEVLEADDVEQNDTGQHSQQQVPVDDDGEQQIASQLRTQLQ